MVARPAGERENTQAAEPRDEEGVRRLAKGRRVERYGFIGPARTGAPGSRPNVHVERPSTSSPQMDSSCHRGVQGETSKGRVSNDLVSPQSTMVGGKFGDFCGALEGHTVEQTDAVRACTQAPLMGTTMWVRLPRDKWPAACGGVWDTQSCRSRLRRAAAPMRHRVGRLVPTSR